jgi:DNA-binding transcriptional MocR family regulator
MVALVTYWLRFGIADKIILAIRNEAGGRQQLARRFLKGVAYTAKPNAHHLWLSLPPQWNRAEFLSHALRDRLEVVADDAFACEYCIASYPRFAWGRVQPCQLGQALQFLADTLKSSFEPLRLFDRWK